MEDIPPSYNNINPGVLDLLPPYISTASLVNLCLVSHAYYDIFISHLWGSPASHFVEVANESSRTTNGINFANLQVSGSQNDMVYVALTRFKRILRKARLSTRQLCHTLHLPPALSEIYGGPNSTWLREVLDWLPSLQSLCVSGLPFFDHESLVAVDQSRNTSTTTDPNDSNFRCYPVKLLLAAKEPNVTWVGLSLLIPHLPDLVYLDLSYTTPARNVNVLRSLDALRHLQVLKLRGIGLRDTELEVLTSAIRLRVRLLDVAENQLSDVSLRSLLQSCVWLPSMRSTTDLMPNEQYSRRRFESWPVGIPPPPDSLSLDTIRTVELDEALLTQLTHPLTGRLAFEDIPHGGITHLYISSNPGITFEGLRSLLDTGTLHVLDVGEIGNLVMTMPTYTQTENGREMHGDGGPNYARMQLADDARQLVRLTKHSLASNAKQLKGFVHRNRARSTPTSDPRSSSIVCNGEDQDEIFIVPGAEKLVPVMREKASKNLTHLRIDHSVATVVLDLHRELKEKEQKVANVPELPGTLSLSAELDSTPRQISEVAGSGSYAAEMSDNGVFEMDATPAPPRAELPGDIIHFAISPPIGDVPHESVDEITSPIRGEGAMAPEVFQPPREEDVQLEQEEEIVLDATGSGIRRTNQSKPGSDIVGQTALPSGEVERPAPLQIRKTISRTQSHYAKEIEALTNSRPKQSSVKLKLHPSFLPNLRTLLLTNVPPTVSVESDLIDNLKAFITECAAEARLALLKARTNYSLPPGRARQDAERQNARELFALGTIILEIDTEQEAASQRGWKRTQRRVNISKSSTGDRDSEAMWSAAENDFSFFGAEGEEAAECGVYDNEPSKYFPTIPFDEKIAITPDDYPNASSSTPMTPNSRHHSPTIGSFSPHPTIMTPSTPSSRYPAMSSPRNLPLGRNRRISGEAPRSAITPSDSTSSPRSPTAEAPGSVQTARMQPLTAQAVQPPPLDVVSELAKWRRERKAAFEQAQLSRARANSASSNSEQAAARLAEKDVYVEGYWAGEVKVIRNNKQAAKGKLERTGKVDIYGNYFEGGYLYP